MELLIVHRRIHTLHSIQLGLATTRHFALDASLKATNISLGAGNIILLRVIGRLQGSSLNSLLLQIATVITLEGLQLSALHFQNAHSHIVQKSTVMADY